MRPTTQFPALPVSARNALGGGTSGTYVQVDDDAFLHRVARQRNCSANPVTGGQIVVGSVTLAHGEATVKGLSPSFKTAASFQCTASDKTTAVNAPNAVAVSGSSIVVRGTGMT